MNVKRNIDINTLGNNIISALEDGIEEICTLVEADAVLNVHVDTGTLKGSITHDVNNQDGEIQGEVGSYGVDYAYFEDRKHPYLSYAVDNNKASMNKIMEKHLKGVR